MNATVTLPVELAPSLRERALALIEAVGVAEVPTIIGRQPERRQENRCVVCHESGVLGGHHGEDGRIEWVHRSCHRRLHRRHHHRHVVAGPAGTMVRAA
jgi:hypothetical protein